MLALIPLPEIPSVVNAIMSACRVRARDARRQPALLAATPEASQGEHGGFLRWEKQHTPSRFNEQRCHASHRPHAARLECKGLVGGACWRLAVPPARAERRVAATIPVEHDPPSSTSQRDLTHPCDSRGTLAPLPLVTTPSPITHRLCQGQAKKSEVVIFSSGLSANTSQIILIDILTKNRCSVAGATHTFLNRRATACVGTPASLQPRSPGHWTPGSSGHTYEDIEVSSRRGSWRDSIANISEDHRPPDRDGSWGTVAMMPPLPHSPVPRRDSDVAGAYWALPSQRSALEGSGVRKVSARVEQVSEREEERRGEAEGRCEIRNKNEERKAEDEKINFPEDCPLKGALSVALPSLAAGELYLKGGSGGAATCFVRRWGGGGDAAFSVHER
ncbi:hypothetical protein O3P69_000583 [Scylla paramamosain]|uniref:Uncharacterized protein n=1 Tax=Scylla paramamosain TaxID=85552 RepID=A0AAW0UVD6_SCYPA